MSQRKWYGGTKNWLAFAFIYLYIHFCIYKHTHFILFRYIFVTFHGETFCLLFLSSNFEYFVFRLFFFRPPVPRNSYSPNARLEPPRWACALCALGLFIYQSLDAIDGKQARRTNSSSPLGELFDHGCDSISTVFVALSACISAQLGFYPKWMFFQVNLFCLFAFFGTPRRVDELG